MNHPVEVSPSAWNGEVHIAAAGLQLEGTLDVPANATGLVLFAHGSGSSHHSPRNRHVAAMLGRSGLATLLFDLLTAEEERRESRTAHLRFDISFLASRLELATQWVRNEPHVGSLPVGYFGASTGAAAALVAATTPGLEIGAVVSRGGRPDLAGRALEAVHASTLLIVGGADTAVLPLNELAYDRLRCVKRLEVVPGATHLFEEPGTLDLAAEFAARWFGEYLRAAA
ncbi:MAG TPA: hypothetical protein VL200_17015 [Lacunisphaera sp.]|jgi:putative phosphoribosyl transferase|nr:hypothetical protein [Lacunisphaera sp.]